MWNNNSIKNGYYCNVNDKLCCLFYEEIHVPVLKIFKNVYKNNELKIIKVFLNILDNKKN